MAALGDNLASGFVAEQHMGPGVGALAAEHAGDDLELILATRKERVNES